MCRREMKKKERKKGDISRTHPSDPNVPPPMITILLSSATALIPGSGPSAPEGLSTISRQSQHSDPMTRYFARAYSVALVKQNQWTYPPSAPHPYQPEATLQSRG